MGIEAIVVNYKALVPDFENNIVTYTESMFEIVMLCRLSPYMRDGWYIDRLALEYTGTNEACAAKLFKGVRLLNELESPTVGQYSIDCAFSGKAEIFSLAEWVLMVEAMRDDPNYVYIR